MSDVILGKLTVLSQGRDAIHVAVIPMKASEALNPGQRVARLGDELAGPATTDRPVVGIVDPFLTEDVPAGDVFWLCLLPNTVTGGNERTLLPQDELSPLLPAQKAVAEFLRNFDEDDYETMFGDHCEVVVKRDGTIDVEEYEHD